MPSVLDTDFPWTNSQENVIEHQEGPLQVIACAGSGKTHTISARIAELIYDGVERDDILAITFNRNAAEELKVRVRDWMERADLEDPSLGNIKIDTVHGFCEYILEEHRPETRSYDVLSENELGAFISQHFFDIGLHEIEPRHPDAKFQKIRWFIEDINTIRRERLIEELDASDEDLAIKLMEIYENYQRLMDDLHFFDYEELIFRAVNLLESDDTVLGDVRDEFEHIIVDEHQDINTSQGRLIELIAGTDPNLCVVGDDDQSIYGWRGARPEDFRDFSGEYGASTEILAENFRSSELIVDLAKSEIEKNSNRINKPMESDRSYDVGDVYQLYFENERNEIEFVVDRIEELEGTVYTNPKDDERTLRWGDVGILFRRKRDMDAYQAELEERRIPYTIRGQNNIFSHPIAKVVRLAFAFIARGQEDDLESQVDGPVEIIDETEGRPDDMGDLETYAVNEEDLREAIGRSEILSGREDNIISELKTIQDWYREPSSRRIEPQAELHKILSAMGISTINDDADASSDGFPEPVMYNIGQISELIKDFETVYEIIFPDQITDLVEFLDFAYFYGKSQIEDETQINAVDLLTIHSAKGMEYPAVFVPGLTTRKFDMTPPRNFTRHTEWIPQDVFDYESYEEDEESKRRLFYVALTRSQKYLCLSGALNNLGYTNRQSPSQFFDELEEINHQGVLYEEVPDPTPREPRDIPTQRQDYVYPATFSDIRYYQKCPYDFKLRKIYGFAPPIDQAFGYGFAIHDVLREMHERHEGDRTGIITSPGEIRQLVRDEDRFHLRYAAGEIEENLRETAEDQMIRYSQGYADDLIRTFRAEVPFEVLFADDENAGTSLISGSIDLIERRDAETNELLELDVVDFKTSEQPDDGTPELRDNRFHVRLFGLATTQEFDPDEVDGYIHYLAEEEDERIEVDLSDPQIEQIREIVQGNVRQIMQRNFFSTPSEDVCEGCDFEMICPHAFTQ